MLEMDDRRNPAFSSRDVLKDARADMLTLSNVIEIFA